MKRVLYFTGYRMVAQEWSGRKLMSSVYFEPDEQGLDLFTAYLSSLKNEPVRLLIDLIEEEFRQIKIPLLRGADRREIINRNFTKYFRSSDYRMAKTQEIIKKERKEERLLLMGLTNQYLLKPWLEIIEASKTPLSGILSLPLVSEDLMSQFKDDNECVILVSQQVPSNLRQSVFLNGKLILSRLVPIASFYQGDYAEDVVRDIESTQRYLFSQRMIDRSDVISVHVLSNSRHMDKLKARCAEDSYFEYHIHNVNDVIEQEKLEVSEEQDFSSVLFCYYAGKKTFDDHYATAAEKKYFHHHIAQMGVRLTGMLAVAVSVGLFAISVGKGLIFEMNTQEMSQLEKIYTSKFNQLSESRIDSATDTTTMQAVVETVQKLEKNYQIRPQGMFVQLSQHFSLFESIRLKEISWFVAPNMEAESFSEVSWDKNASRRGRGRGRGRTSPPGLYEIAVLNGEFTDFDGNYRFVLSALDDLEGAMRVSGDYDSVEVLKRPLDIEPKNSLSGEFNAAQDVEGKTAEFSLRVVRKVNRNEK